LAVSHDFMLRLKPFRLRKEMELEDRELDLSVPPQSEPALDRQDSDLDPDLDQHSSRSSSPSQPAEPNGQITPSTSDNSDVPSADFQEDEPPKTSEPFTK
jgi:hypothetical protein